MTAAPSPAPQLIRQAYAAIKRGDRRAARQLANQAAALSPELEDPWLLLAAVASPRASIGYIEQALKINPNSPSARQALDWARERLRRERAASPSSSARPASQAQPPPIKRNPGAGRAMLWLLVLGAVIVLAAGMSLPGAASRLSPLLSEISKPAVTAQTWGQVQVAKPSYTPTVTPTATPTPTASPTPSETPPPAALDVSDSSFYTAQSNDTLNKIAAHFGVDVYALAAHNKMALNATLYTGQTIIIPDPAWQPPASYSYEPVTVGGPKKILVDISEQRMYVYEGETLIWKFVASTGMGNSTRAGSFRVQSKIANAYGATWNIWMPNWLGIYWSGYLENGIHALPILPNGATLWAGYLGRPISYGCVVLSAYDAQTLYNWAEIGTPVIIQW